MSDSLRASPCVPGQLVALLEVDGERPFVVTVCAEKGNQVGYRVGFVWAATEDEAVGRWMRYATADNPGWTISTPAALHINEETLAAARERHNQTATTAAEANAVGIGPLADEQNTPANSEGEKS